MNKTFTIGFVTTYLPKECGIATYSDNLIKAIKSIGTKTNFKIIALSDKKYQYPDIVKFSINFNDDQDYIKAAEYINNSDIDVVSLQHEFNIYGGYNGKKILLLLKNLKKPVVMTMHTVPIFQTKPFKIIPKRYKTRTPLLKKMFKYINGITVMNDIAKNYVRKKLNFKKKIITILHGAPELTPQDLLHYRKEKNKTGFQKDDIIITTFGLISPQKGLEYVIKALPYIEKKHPNKKIKYLIAGKIHPAKPKQYLDTLKYLAKKLGVEKDVILDSRYLTWEEIYRYLANTYLYITPYYRKEQSSSGTLSYAVVAGCCIVSTPYIYAYDMVKNHKVGELVKFKDSRSIAKVINNLVENPSIVTKYRNNSIKFSKNIYWPNTAKNFIKFLKDNTK
jgi:glycosyltransferase involved in cell wall biosynthesis